MRTIHGGQLIDPAADAMRQIGPEDGVIHAWLATASFLVDTADIDPISPVTARAEASPLEGVSGSSAEGVGRLLGVAPRDGGRGVAHESRELLEPHAVVRQGGRGPVADPVRAEGAQAPPPAW